MVIGTTGLSEVELTKIKEKAAEVPLVFSPNMSVGVNLMFKIAQLVSSTLGMEFDAEIIELHHNKKKDAPSGTALALAQAVADGRQQDLNTIVNYGRQGLTGERPVGQLGIHAVRGGDIVGEHSVIFAGPNERIELKHIAQNRALFAEGAVRAAIFLENKAMGFYSMLDVLGLSD
jgi:4-hydroxy-tetrahydrodipicolinate reductase